MALRFVLALIASGRLDGHEIHAHPGRASHRVDGNLRHQLGVVEAAPLRELQTRARMPVAMNDENAVMAYPLRHFETHRLGADAVLVDEDHLVAVREAPLARDLGAQPE